MKNNRYCVIMAGGIGTRFWPKSRQSMPKQFLDILGTGKSFIRQTFERFSAQVPQSNFLVVTNARYKELVLEHIPELSPSQVLCEPIGRNTAPCIAYAAYYIASINPEAQMIVTPSDHYITDEKLFVETIDDCLDFIAQNDALMTIGIRPTRAETGYGYIQVSSQEPISKVKCFTEKPNAQLAETFVQCGEFVWNSGIFVWSVRSIIAAFQEFLPEHHQLFGSISDSYGTPAEAEKINRAFSECKAISIDYGVMEKASNVYVRIGEFSWSDVGTWSALFGHLDKDVNNNVVSANSYLYNVENSIISKRDDKLIVASGLKDYIVVDTDDVLLICPRSEEQNIKNFTEDIKYRDGAKHL
ncbi:MAG: mannose-1-phosphate guanylyltransferase [Rikenellaceae bacterium]